MEEPTIAAKQPVKVDLQAGTHHWCACGRSKSQPLCDGSHQGTSFTPLQFELTEAKAVWLCQCKHTGKPPYCDGTHKKL